MTPLTRPDVPSLADTPAVPLFTGERIEALDVLRGFAIFGILLANIHVFSGYVLMPDAQRAALPTAAVDGTTMLLLQMLVAGKFYSIFSLLFGIGFAVQLQRSAAARVDPARRFRRRLVVLMLIGAAHSLLLWYGDILFLYALVGFCLLPFRSRGDRRVLAAALICLLVPLVQYGLMLGGVLLAGGGAAPDGVADATNPLDSLIATLTTGSYLEAVRVNLTGLMYRWGDLFFTGRFFKVLAMFLFGLWIVRRGLLIDAPTSRATIRRAATVGLLIGLPLNALLAMVGEHSYYSLEPRGLAFAVLYSIGVPTLAIGYAGLVVIAWRNLRGRRVLGALGPVGRMALTNYLLQTVIALLIFYGFGLGFFGRVGATPAIGVAIAIFVVQLPVSAWWLRRYRHGPAEWLWRRLTLAQPLPMRREPLE